VKVGDNPPAAGFYVLLPVMSVYEGAEAGKEKILFETSRLSG